VERQADVECPDVVAPVARDEDSLVLDVARKAGGDTTTRSSARHSGEDRLVILETQPLHLQREPVARYPEEPGRPRPAAVGTCEGAADEPPLQDVDVRP
jgi:hypothetical protein